MFSTVVDSGWQWKKRQQRQSTVSICTFFQPRLDETTSWPAQSSSVSMTTMAPSNSNKGLAKLEPHVGFSCAALSLSPSLAARCTLNLAPGANGVRRGPSEPHTDETRKTIIVFSLVQQSRILLSAYLLC